MIILDELMMVTLLQLMTMTCMCSRIEKAKHWTDSVSKDHSHGNTDIKMMMMVAIMMMKMMMMVMMIVIMIFIIW